MGLLILLHNVGLIRDDCALGVWRGVACLPRRCYRWVHLWWRGVSSDLLIKGRCRCLVAWVGAGGVGPFSDVLAVYLSCPAPGSPLSKGEYSAS